MRGIRKINNQIQRVQTLYGCVCCDLCANRTLPKPLLPAWTTRTFIKFNYVDCKIDGHNYLRYADRKCKNYKLGGLG